MEKQFSIENAKILRWVKKYYPNNYEIIKNSIKELLNVLDNTGFFTKDIDFYGFPIQFNGIKFEKFCDDGVEYILIIFDKYGSLKFQVSFGVKKITAPDAPYDWIRCGNLVRWDSENISAKWWGSHWYNIWKEKSFQNDWNKFLNNIPHILNFIRNGSVDNFNIKKSKYIQ